VNDRNLAVEARMLVAQAGGRAHRTFVTAALADLFDTTPDIADAWIDHAETVGLIRTTSEGTLGLTGPLNGRRIPLAPDVIAATQATARAHYLDHPIGAPHG
jgi:hypothetical protein